MERWDWAANRGRAGRRKGLWEEEKEEGSELATGDEGQMKNGEQNCKKGCKWIGCECTTRV